MIDKFSRIPIYEQLVEGVEREITAGMLHSGDGLPSIRELSAEIGVNPNTIQKAYAELSRRGIIGSSPGSGYYVTPTAMEEIRQAKERQLVDLEQTLQELKAAGITQDSLIALIERVYRKEEKEN